MSQYTHKMVNGELVELTTEEIAELEQRDKDAEVAQPEQPEPKDGEHRSKRK